MPRLSPWEVIPWINDRIQRLQAYCQYYQSHPEYFVDEEKFVKRTGQACRASKRKYYQEYREERLAARREYYQKNREECRAASLKYYYEHREAYRAARRKYYQENHKERCAYNDKYRKEHRETRRIASLKYYYEHREERRAARRKNYQEHRKKELNMSINSISLLCEVVREPEILTPKTYVIGKFSVKVRKDTAKESYSYFDVEAWGEKLVQKVRKFVQQGQVILISGKLDSSSWQDKETGKNRSKVFIVANDVSSIEALIHPEDNPTQDTPAQHKLPPKQSPPPSNGQPWQPPENSEPPF